MATVMQPNSNSGFNIANQPAGVIVAVRGSATATDASGIERRLAVGDTVYLDETIRTGAAGALAIQLADGTRLDLGRSSQMVLDPEVVDPNGELSPTEAASSVEAIQQAILAGEDPTLIAPAPAAGADQTAAAADEGGHSFVRVALTGEAVLPTSGFPTEGLAFAFPDGVPILLEDREFGDDGDGNAAPDAEDAAIVTDEDTPISAQVVATDANNDVLTFALLTPPVHGSVVFNPDGSYTYTPAPDYNGPDQFIYQVDDGNGGTDTGVVDIIVNPQNDAPVAADDAIATDEDTAISDRVTATDADGDDLTFTLLTPPAHGSVTFNPDGTYTYTPAPDYNGPDEFTYQVDDGNGGVDEGRVTIEVRPQNDAPVANDDSFTVAEDSPPVTRQVSATDPDGDALSFALVTGPAHGTLVFNPDGSYTYTPDADYNGPDSFTFRTSDGSLTDEGVVNIQVTPVNDPPVAPDFSVSTPEDQAISARVIATDVDGDPLTYTLVAGPAHGTLVFNADGSYIYTPAADYNGPDRFTYRASDGRLTDNGVVSINVTPVDDPIVLANDANTVDEANPALAFVPTTVGGNVLANDSALGDLPGRVSNVEYLGSEAVTRTVAANGTITIAQNQGVWRLTVEADGDYRFTLSKPVSHAPGADSALENFRYTYTDADGDSGQAGLDITIIDDVPIARDDNTTAPVTGNQATTGNVISGLNGGANAMDDPGSDGYSPAGPVRTISNGSVTRSFDGTADGSDAQHGDFFVLQGKLGELTFHEDGFYRYTVNDSAGLAGSGTPAQVERSWDTVELRAFSEGRSFVDGAGKLNLSRADARPDFEPDGVGVDSPVAPGRVKSEQLNHDPVTGRSEALAVNFRCLVQRASVQVSHLFRTESGGEIGMWIAFDAAFNQVGEGRLDVNTVDYGNSRHEGTAEIAIENGAGGLTTFQYLVFTALPYGEPQPGNTRDSSDYFVRSIDYEFAPGQQDRFNYTIADADGDTDGASLTLTLAQSAIEGKAGDNALQGTAGDDALRGGAGDDTLRGLAGDDVLDGGTGADSSFGGGGQDLLVYDALDLRLDGGSGHDTLRVDTDADFRNDSVQLHDIETIDLAGASSAALRVQDVVQMTDADHTLFVAGDAGDQLAIGPGWTAAAASGAPGFALYTADHAGDTVKLFVDNQINVVV